MTIIGSEGELVECPRDFAELAADISMMMSTAAVKILNGEMEDGEGNSVAVDLESYIEAILLTVISAVGNGRVTEGVLNASASLVERAIEGEIPGAENVGWVKEIMEGNEEAESNNESNADPVSGAADSDGDVPDGRRRRARSRAEEMKRLAGRQRSRRSGMWLRGNGDEGITS